MIKNKGIRAIADAELYKYAKNKAPIIDIIKAGTIIWNASLKNHGFDGWIKIQGGYTKTYYFEDIILNSRDEIVVVSY